MGGNCSLLPMALSLVNAKERSIMQLLQLAMALMGWTTSKSEIHGELIGEKLGTSGCRRMAVLKALRACFSTVLLFHDCPLNRCLFNFRFCSALLALACKSRQSQFILRGFITPGVL